MTYFEKFTKSLTDLKFRFEIPGEVVGFSVHRDKLQEIGRAVLSTLFYDHRDCIPSDAEYFFRAEDCIRLGEAILRKMYPGASVTVVTAQSLRNGIRVFYEGGREEIFDG